MSNISSEFSNVRDGPNGSEYDAQNRSECPNVIDGILHDDGTIEFYDSAINEYEQRFKKISDIAKLLRPNTIYNPNINNLINFNQISGYKEFIDYFKFISESFDFIYYLLSNFKFDKNSSLTNPCEISIEFYII